MTERVLFVNARPGDETAATGATIADLVDRGSTVTVLSLGDGTAPEALAELGVVDHRVLPGIHDGTAADIADVIVELNPDVVVSCGADGRREEPVRAYAHRATRSAAEALGVPLYAVVAGQGRTDVVVDSPSALDRKRAALAVYAGQSAAAPAIAERLARLKPVGAFAEQSVASRIGSIVLAAVIGAITGATVTVAHQASAEFAGVTVPWGIIAALTIVFCLLAGLRLVFGTRVVAAAAAIGVVVSTLVLASRSSGGSVLVPDNVVGYALLAGITLIVVVTLAWPRARRRAR